jgi:formate dehydrogenase major subunit
MATINLTINGRLLEAEAGQTILDVARANNIDIPTLCFHPQLERLGGCRLCLVEIAKVPQLQPACTYPVSEGIVVETDSLRAVGMRKFVLEMLFSERNHYCMFCEMSGDCALQSQAYRHGLDHWTYPTPYPKYPVDGTRKYFIMDHNRCILCRRCIRACNDVVGNHTLGLKLRGSNTLVCADMDVPFGESTCISCGTCLQVCPTGALVDRKSAYMGRDIQVERVKSACTFCSVGCVTQIVTRGGHVLRVEGDWEGHNAGVLCVQGRFDPLYDNRQRVSTPVIRRNGTQTAVSWDEALSTVAQRVKDAGGHYVKAYTTGKVLGETMDEFVNLFRRNVGATVGILEPLEVANRLPSDGLLTNLDTADYILVAGADPLEDHQVVGARIKRARFAGVEVIVVSDTENRLAPLAQNRFVSSQIKEAMALCHKAVSPVVIYGAATSEPEVQALASLKGKARFLPLFPATNGNHAKALGLGNGLLPVKNRVVYLLIEDKDFPEEKVQEIRDADFLVVHACYHGSLTAVADVVLPAPLWYEQEGTFSNLEGVEVSVTQAVPLPEGLVPEREVLTQLGSRM